MSRDYVTKILKARVYDVARETPLELAPKLSSRLGSEVWLKREDLQPVFSFKLRGAYNKLASLTPEARARGVIASSAGNHAQGVALAARRLGTRALIVMPETAPRIKVDAVESLGAEVVLSGDTYDGAKERAEALASERGMVLIPPYDDEHVIAGQGTVGMEIVRQQGEAFDAIFVSVGGGGLIAGIAAYIKALWPKTRIVGVEPRGHADPARRTRSRRAGRAGAGRHVCRRRGGETDRGRALPYRERVHRRGGARLH